MPGNFVCTVITPEEQLLEQEVRHVSIPAWDGQIGLLRDRAPLLARLGYGVMDLELASGQRQRYFVGGGFAQMRGNELAVLTDEARPLADLDEDQAEANLKQVLSRTGSDRDPARQERDVERARGLLAAARHSA
ncbi:MAG: ATP synthase F1 subunit epsilon [Phycisphaeraceae bacterium]